MGKYDKATKCRGTKVQVNCQADSIFQQQPQGLLQLVTSEASAYSGTVSPMRTQVDFRLPALPPKVLRNLTFDTPSMMCPQAASQDVPRAAGILRRLDQLSMFDAILWSPGPAYTKHAETTIQTVKS